MQPHKKSQNSLFSPMGLILMGFLLVTLLIILFAPQITEMFKEREITYCRFERDILDLVPRRECTVMKIVSDDMGKVDVSQFKKLNATSYECSENYESLKPCEADSFYSAYYPLDLFCDDCIIDGFICLGYYITYFENRTDWTEFYESSFMQNNITSKEELDNIIINCEER